MGKPSHNIMEGLVAAARPSEMFMQSYVAVRWKDGIVVLSESKRRSLWIYNLWTEQWREYELRKENCLPVDINQRGVEIGLDIYMFGSFSDENTLWKLARSTDNSFAWSRIQIKDRSKTPSKRKGHSVWEYDGKMWVYGGYGDSLAGYLNNHGDFDSDMSIVTTNSLIFRGHNNQLLSYDPCLETWTNVPCSGDVPAPRKDASTATIKDKLYLHGGSPSNERYTKNMYVLDMHLVIWSRIETTGLTRPLRQTNVSFTPVTVNQLVFIDNSQFQGVIWIFDVQSHTWKKHLGKDIGYDYDHTGITGLRGSAIILGETVQPVGQAYNPLITVRLEPKHLQQLAMQKVDTTLWRLLPKKLTLKMTGTE